MRHFKCEEIAHPMHSFPCPLHTFQLGGRAEAFLQVIVNFFAQIHLGNH